MSKIKRNGSGFSTPAKAVPTPATPRQVAQASTQHIALEQQAVDLIQRGQFHEAEVIYRNLIASGTTNHLTYGNLAAICGRQGRYDELIGLLNNAIRLKPDYPEAHNNLGNALKERGDLNAAIASFKTSIQLKPDNPETHYNLGNALKKQGDLTAAIVAYDAALKLKPNHLGAHNNLGVALQEQGDLTAAIASYNAAIKLKPDNPEAHNNLGNTRKQQGDLTAAIACFNAAIKFKPDYSEAHNNLGTALKQQGDISAALDSFKTATQFNPDNAETHVNLGNVLQEQGELAAAIAAYNTALRLKPDLPEVHKNLSMAELASGDYKSGWERYEYRFKCQKDQGILNAHPNCPQWNGTALKANDQLLLVSEQGLGDTLQFMRYALHLRSQAVAVSLCAQTKLHGLIQASGIHPSPLTPKQAHAVTEGHWLPLLSLPRHLKVSPDHPIVNEPYIRTTDELINKWREVLSREKRPIIAINWQGNPEHEKSNSQGRSLPLETFAPIAQYSNASLLSLQKGSGSEQLETCSFRDRFVGCQQQVDATWDFLETAAIIANCDLVISSDTSAAHLAGGMGKTTWLLLKKVPEWRWGLEGTATFWYPSMRLFRQTEPGNWDEVLQRVAQTLQKELPAIGADHSSISGEGEQLPPPDKRLSALSTHESAKIGDQIQRQQNLARSRKEPAIIAIPTLTQYHLLARLCARLLIGAGSEKPHSSKIVILDNGGNFLNTEAGKSLAKEKSIQIHIPPYNLGVAGSWNYFAKKIGRCIIANDDVIFDQKAIDELETAAADHPHAIIMESDHPVGGFATFLLNDPLKWLEMGGFDEMFNPAYFEDNDARIRLSLDGNPSIRVKLSSWRHDNSSTLVNSSKDYQRMHKCLYNRNKKYYTDKWGGLPGEEVFTTPFGRETTTSKQVSQRSTSLSAPLSLGELIDKITILQIKTEHFTGAALKNVKKELRALQATLDGLDLQVDAHITQRLKVVNSNLWRIEDDIRNQERKKDFGEDFIQLARSVYQQNDRRAAIKKEINTTYGSDLVEEKSYQDY